MKPYPAFPGSARATGLTIALRNVHTIKAARTLVAGGAALLLSCSGATRGAERPERLEPALLRVLESRPDSVVGILLRLNRDVRPEDQEQLRQHGLTIGSARGRLVTGQLRAADARKLTRLTQVDWIELSGAVRITRNPNEPGAS